MITLQDISAFTALLVENRTALSSLDSVWESFVDAEVVNARLSVADDIAVIDKKTGETARQKELQSRRTRKQQASIFEWSEGIHDVEATRVAHVSPPLYIYSIVRLMVPFRRRSKISRNMQALSQRSGRSSWID